MTKEEREILSNRIIGASIEVKIRSLPLWKLRGSLCLRVESFLKSLEERNGKLEFS